MWKEPGIGAPSGPISYWPGEMKKVPIQTKTRTPSRIVRGAGKLLLGALDASDPDCPFAMRPSPNGFSPNV